MDEQSKQLFTKLAKIMGEVSRIPKNGKNTHFNYTFATESDISDAIRTLLSQNNIACFASMVSHDQKAVGNTLKTVCTFEFTLACGDTGATHSCLWTGEANDGQDKGYNKAATAAMKYWLLKTFMIPVGEDPDADGSPNPKAGKGASANPKQRAPQPPAHPTVGNPTQPAQPKADPPRVAELRNEMLTITQILPRTDSSGWYGIGHTDGLETRVNLFAPEDPDAIEAAGYEWKTGACEIPVILRIQDNRLRIATVTPKAQENAANGQPDAVPAWLSTEVGKCWQVLKAYLVSENVYANEFEMKASMAKRGVLVNGKLSKAWEQKPASELFAFLKTRHQQTEVDIDFMGEAS